MPHHSSPFTLLFPKKTTEQQQQQQESLTGVGNKKKKSHRPFPGLELSDLCSAVSAATPPGRATQEQQFQRQQQHPFKKQLHQFSQTLPTAPLIACSEHLLQPNGSIVGRSVAEAILPRFPDLISAIPESDRPALASTNDTASPSSSSTSGIGGITHSDIRAFLTSMGPVLHQKMGVGRGTRVAVVLPNGPELALALLVVSSYASCVPLNALSAILELEFDWIKANVLHVIGLAAAVDNSNISGSGSGNTNTSNNPTLSHHTVNPAIEQLANRLGIPFTGLVPDSRQAGLFSLRPPSASSLTVLKTNTTTTAPKSSAAKGNSKGSPIHCFATPSEADRSAGHYSSPRRRDGSSFQPDDTIDSRQMFQNRENTLPNQHDDEVLVLFTSGTTGSKKLVPHTLSNVLVGTACIAVSWKLTPHDTNCNLMPLFHVGGILRQVFSPVLSGGCVICCPAFDPVTFWQLLKQNKFTWYYAAPTMHQLILQTGRSEGYIGSNTDNKSSIKTSLRMIANAAGGLLPATARELRQAFAGAHILPSYGMTECMPITSPPAEYLLEKPGTSGVAVGPEVAILNTVTCRSVQTGNEGMICVRGEPCFRGYGHIPGEDSAQSPFLSGGWFNTGDLGYMDSDGYLYITGRSKEVINRGGEIISPMEVEEAIMEHPSVTACVAFSTTHSVLQECVGLLLVPNSNLPRIDLPTLHEYLGQGRLAAPKWPQCLVYTDAVPKSFTNKLLRVKLGKRLSLPEMNDSMYWIERTFQAKCPPQGTDVSVTIPCERVAVSAEQVQRQLREAMNLEDINDIVVVPHATKIGALVAYVSSRVDRLLTVKTARQTLHAYAVPSHVCICSTGISPVDLLTSDQQLPPQPSDAIGSILQEEQARGLGPADPLVMELQEVMQNLLDLDCLPAPDTNFFNLGGSSMLASQLASKIRKQHNVPFGGAEVFHSSTCNAIAGVIRERRGEGTDNASESAKQSVSSMGATSLLSLKLDLAKTPFDTNRLDPRSGLFGLLFQLVPLIVVYPIWQLTRLFLFFRTLLWLLYFVPGERYLLKFLLTLIVFHSIWVTVTPLMFVILKWTLIGKYRQGRYPLWGVYYLQWWFLDVMRKLIGRGSWGAHPQMLNLYYRMLGANIGKGARISTKAEIAEFDLVTIGEDAAVELSTVRGFGVDNGCMVLGPVGVGRKSSVGVRSVVALYTSVPDGVHLGPVSSSYEACTGAEANIHHLRYNRHAFNEPCFLSNVFVVAPITLLVDAFSQIPPMVVLYSMLVMHWNYNAPFSTVGELIEWLASPKRILFYVGIRIARAICSPLFYMVAAIIMKWCVIGKFRSGPRDTKSEWQLIRHSLAASLFSRERMQDVADLVGRHYELVSILYRILGAKVGKRVFWPGRQPVFTGEFDLLEIGDDVVFGSRSTLICTTVDSCEKIVLCAGSNISDNTVVLPGSAIGKGAVLGSNSLCPEGRYLPESSVWLGARGGNPILLEKGAEDANGPLMVAEVDQTKFQMEGDESTIRPFGKAFYRGEANYFVYRLALINIFTFFTRSSLAILGTLPILGALHLSAGYIYGWRMADRNYENHLFSSVSLYGVLLGFFTITHFLHVVVWLFVDVATKWLVMGRRHPGRYNYDTSDYAQRWELYQIVTRVRELGRMNFLDFICGTPFMVTFFRLLGSKIGSDCCLYPAGFEPMMPEPDLVEMGDNCLIDCASVVCHLNTRGNFELAKITLHNNVTLRTGARIQQAVVMETGSMLLEKSLAMTGEIIEADSVWLGAPAARLLSYDTSSIVTRSSASYAGSNDGGGFV